MSDATVQDVRKNVPAWWEHGTGRTMFSQRTANSRSWSILLPERHLDAGYVITVVKKVPPAPATDYKIASALHRAEMVAMYVPHPDEFLPIVGVLHVTFNAKPIRPGTEAEVFGLSRMAIPQYREVLKKLKERSE